jgi:hypothetical protein
MSTLETLTEKSKAERNAYKRDYYRRKGPTPAHTRWLERRLTAIWEIKEEKGCVHCGEKNPIVLDFHHRDPSEKTMSIRELEQCSAQRFEEEVAKCDVLCANCHRIVEHEQRMANNGGRRRGQYSA